MSNFGFEHLSLVNAYDVAYREARSAVKAGAVLEASQNFATIGEAIAGCELVVGTASPGHRALQHTMRRLEVGGPMIRAALDSGPVALLFGSEKFGLSNDEMSHCHWLMHIPTRAEHESMNLGQAVAICLYEIVRAEVTTFVPRKPKRTAPSEDLERIQSLLIEAMEECGYLNPVTRTSSELKVRRMLHRINLSAVDTPLWLGALRQILWRFKNQRP
jgi:TrmH family RNA methyltransferase